MRQTSFRIPANLLHFSVVLILLTLTPLASQELSQEDNGLTGHFGVRANLGAPPEGFTHGFSAYGTIHELSSQPTSRTQIGWGTWLRPDNRGVTSPLCPEGTIARDNWPERGPSYWEVYQSIEGGVGSWASTKFPSQIPKFRINATPDCYNNQISSPGWLWGSDQTVPPWLLTIAQLSNRILAPPDGFTMAMEEAPGVLGYGWIALPLIPAMTSSLGAPTGDQSWTLFFHSANFKGPVAFYTPDAWSAVNAGNPEMHGTGLDSLPGFFDGVAVEIGTSPMFTGTDAEGNRWRRVPRLTFPVNGNGTAIIQQDVVYYSKEAIWNGMAAWIAEGTVASGFNNLGVSPPAQLDNPFFQPTLGGSTILLDASFGAGVVQTSGGVDGLGLIWAGNLEPGVFPEYFKEVGDDWMPVAESLVPNETLLKDQTFDLALPGFIPDLDVSGASPWSSDGWSAGPFTAELADGSTVEYVWYKFIDQPAIKRLALADSVRDALQTFVESLHENAGLNGPVFDGPSGGTLVSLDEALIVTPPAGLEAGYVPIVIRQFHLGYYTPTQAEIDALTALYTATNGANWSSNTNWLTGDVHTWHGVTVEGGAVRKLELFGNNLTGTLPAEIGTLSSLTFLELSQNALTGSIPSTIGNLTDLVHLSAFNNDLSGEIPGEIGNLGKVELIQLGSNQLTGELPASLGSLSHLQYLFLAGNQLTGPVPESWGGLTGLVQLDLASNDLSGALPSSLADLTALEVFHFHGTQICVPEDEALQQWLSSIPTVTPSGVECAVTTVGMENALPAEFALYQNYPNPFNPETVIRFDLPEAVSVSIRVFDILGKEVARIALGDLPPGQHVSRWNPEGLAAGVYLLRLEAGSFGETRKLLLLK